MDVDLDEDGLPSMTATVQWAMAADVPNDPDKFNYSTVPIVVAYNGEHHYLPTGK